MNLEFSHKLPVPQQVKAHYPVSPEMEKIKNARQQEIADIFVVNKADNAEADALYSQLLATFSFLPFYAFER